MGENGKFYDVEDFGRWKRQQGAAYRIPPRANFLAAANHIRNVFEGKKLNWAAMLGLAMLCLGSRREMPDIHIAYDDRDFQRIKLKLESDHRVRLPKGMNSLFPTKLLISTGPKYKDPGCTDNADVEVDLVPFGSHGTPTTDILRNNQVLLRLNRDGKSEGLKGLNMLYLVKTTVYYCKSQDLVWDPRKDVLFLCKNYGKEIEAVRGQLNTRQVQENFLGTPFFSRLSADEQMLCYRVLLGTEPPPLMSITPAPPIGHRHTASASELTTRPRITSHQSSPSLNTAMQQPSSFLSPPLPGKPKARTQGPMSAPPTQTLAPSTVISQNTPVVSASASASATEIDSRSRYRRTSAPNTGVGRNISPETTAHNAPRPISMDAHGTHQRPVVPSLPRHSAGTQNMAHAPRPQAIPGHAPGPVPTNTAPMGMRSQKSMPAMAVSSKGTVPIYAHGQNAIPPIPKGAAIRQQPSPATAQVPRVSSSQLTQPNSSFQGIPHTSQHKEERKSSMPSNHPRTSTQPILPQSGHGQHIKQVGNMNEIGRNHINPTNLPGMAPLQGLHARPQDSSLQKTIPRNQPRELAGTSPSNFVFELDASPSPPANAPQNAAPSGFIAELQADAIPRPLFAPANQTGHTAHSEMLVSPPQEHTHMSFSQRRRYSESPVSPPVANAIPVPVQPLPTEPQHASPSPPNVHSQPPTFDALPPSLLAGAQGPRRRSPNSSLSHPTPNPAIPQTNATKYQPKYQRYYSPPASAPNSAQVSPKQMPATVSSYKAYSRPISPPMHPSAAPAKLQKPPSIAHIQASYALLQHSPANPSVPAAVPTTVQGTGPRAPEPQKNMPYRFPNPLGANPPTPTSTGPTKHDFHDNRNIPHALKAGAVVAGAGVVGTATYVAYSYSENAPQYQPSQEAQNIPYNNVHAPSMQQSPQPLEQDYYFVPREPTGAQAEYTHHRSVSQGSHASNDSEKLAEEYRQGLPNFEEGYASPKMNGGAWVGDEDEFVDFT